MMGFEIVRRSIEDRIKIEIGKRLEGPIYSNLIIHSFSPFFKKVYNSKRSKDLQSFGWFSIQNCAITDSNLHWVYSFKKILNDFIIRLCEVEIQKVKVIAIKKRSNDFENN